MGFLGCFVVGVLGMLFGYLMLGGGNNSNRCNSIDLDPTTDVIDRLPLACVEVTGAYYVEKDISQSGKACILSSTVTAAVFVLESSLLLSRTVQNTNPNTFAGFEATIYFSYSLFANIGWIGIYIGEQNNIFPSFDDWTNYTTRLGYEYAQLYPEGFPITFNQTEKLRLQYELASSIWMNSSVVYLVGFIIVAVQVAGLYFATCGRESVWMIEPKPIKKFLATRRDAVVGGVGAASAASRSALLSPPATDRRRAPGDSTGAAPPFARSAGLSAGYSAGCARHSKVLRPDESGGC